MPMHGPYDHAADAIAVKAFATPDGRRRSFSVLVARGVVAGGVYMSDRNGLAVVDLDNRTVVFDGDAAAPVGAREPTPRQARAFEGLLGMGWDEFSAFCASRPGYRRGNAPDMASPAPDAPRSPASAVARAAAGLSRLPLATVGPGILSPCVATGWDPDGLDLDVAGDALSSRAGPADAVRVVEDDGCILAAVTVAGGHPATHAGAAAFQAWLRSPETPPGAVSALGEAMSRLAAAVEHGPDCDRPRPPGM